MIKSVPIPTAGVALGLAALGNLLHPYSIAMKYFCGSLSLCLMVLLFLKIFKYPKLVHADMIGNPILGSVAATFFMTLMQLCVYAKNLLPLFFEFIWFLAVFSHIFLILWFSKHFLLNLELKNVFPTFFIAYVGIVVASVTAPAFNHLTLGYYIFWFGFIAYMFLLALVTYRYFHHPVADAAKPLICIYTAPMSLSLAGYFAVVPEKSFLMISIMQIAAQILFFFILSLMPKLLRLPFYPSYAAFTFPFVITAIALRSSIDYYEINSSINTGILQYLYYFECLVATFFVFYVTIHFCRFFYKEWFTQKEVVQELVNN